MLNVAEYYYKVPHVQDQVVNHPSRQEINSIENALYGAGSELIRSELGAYGEKILGSGSNYVRNNIGRYVSNPRYYFQVSDQYVENKLKVVLFPFLHKGHWMRSVDSDGSNFTYKPPVYDINAPDLYIPLMAFCTYVILAGFFLGFSGRFSPEALGVQFSNGLLCWLLQVLLIEVSLHYLGGGDIPLLDVVGYAGYTFVAASVLVVVRILWSYSFYVVTAWECFCMGVFLVKTMKRILVAEVPSSQKSGSKTKRNYLLLLVAIAQFPLLFWLGKLASV
ncbi:hypothetical protein DCAR_0522194 [Daucus carota subsp. sativus]|uniref:Uncharacterized protein n=1 Tax=Daucus carota subsp. sativus TaxID=79200 RepID=A0AAF0X997_DAUCS|nr:hypothetical protein DCAR_0522194 [Daucus carota subsp. sativus]